VNLRRPSIRALLLGANAAVVGLPLLLLAGLRVYDIYLLRQTERQLLAESAVIAEVFREAYRAETGIADDDHRPPDTRRDPYASDEHPPPGASRDRYAPVEAIIDFGTPVLPAQPSSLRSASPDDGPQHRAGQSIEPILRRAQTFNLSAVRVLDARGCVVATTRSESGLCLDVLPEVRGALRGRYAAVLRARISDEPKPPYGDVRRRGGVRVFTALPVFSNGQVIAVVRASRTGLDALSSLWAYRRDLLLAGFLFSALSIAVSVLFSAAIAAPLRKLTRSARAIARGEPAQPLRASGFAPAEVVALSLVLQHMTDQLRERAQYIAQFASHASHELKTPITAIRGATELLQQNWQKMHDAQRERFLANIMDDAEHMERLVARLLELARVENAPGELVPKLRVQPFVRNLLERYGDAVQLSVANAPEAVQLPEWHLQSVLVNLVENALRHAAGERVLVALSSEGGRLRIEVSDRGPGIPEAHLDKLFDRFFTTERERGGTGLGLAIVKAIAEGRGGRVAARSSAQGSTFSVVL
jgi:signal transduction histidine kinase